MFRALKKWVIVLSIMFSSTALFANSLYTTIESGFNHTLAIKKDGTLWVWGKNYYGQLGNGTTTDNPTPTQIGSDKSWKVISAGKQYSFAVKENGTLWGWGANHNKQLGDGSSTARHSPTQIGSDTNWEMVSAYYQHTIAIKKDGTIWTWGENNNYQLGLGTQTDSDIPLQVGTDTNWKVVFAGQDVSMAIKKDGTLWGWGQGSAGRIGHGSSGTVQTPLQIGTDTNWKQLSLGQDFGLAIKKDGTLWAWGNAGQGQLGNADNTVQTSPIKIGTDTNWKVVATGQYHSLAVKTDGTLWTWGYNSDGALGDGTTTNKNIPTQVGSETTWNIITAGYHQGMALKTIGTLWTWGRNLNGELGNGTTENKATPIQLGTDTTWGSVSNGVSFSTAIKSDGTLWGWGQNKYNQLAPSGSRISIPTQISSDNNWSYHSATNEHTLAIKTDGTLWAWGYNNKGRLGDGTTSNRNAPVQIGSDTWTTVYASEDFSHGIKTDGTLWAWGSNSYGRLGDNSGTNKESPVQIGSDTWQSVSGAGNYAHAVKTDGTLWSWGYKYGGLGYSSSSHVYTPKQVGTDTNWNKVVNGIGHSLALKSDGTLWSWGSNSQGKLGHSGPTNVPTQVGTDTNWSFIAAGADNSFAIKTDGTLWAWGDNNHGQLGYVTASSAQSTPKQIGTATNWKSVSSGDEHTTAVKLDGTIYVWGSNNNGQLAEATLIPTFVGSTPFFVTSSTLSVNKNITDITSLESHDARGSSATFSYAINDQNDSSHFALSGANLSFKTGKTYDNPQDDNNDSIYVVDLNMTSSLGSTVSQTFYVSVNSTEITFSGSDYNSSSTKYEKALTGRGKTNGSIVPTSPNSSNFTFSTTSGQTQATGFRLNSNGTYNFDASSYASLASGQNQTVIGYITVDDGKGDTIDVTVEIIITGENDAPTITNFPNKVLYKDFDDVNVSYTVSDIDTGTTLGTPVLSVSDNTIANITLDTNNSVIKLSSISEKSGVTNVTLSVSDGSLTTLKSFKLKVLSLGTGINIKNNGQVSSTTEGNKDVTTVRIPADNLTVKVKEDSSTNGVEFDVNIDGKQLKASSSISGATVEIESNGAKISYDEQASDIYFEVTSSIVGKTQHKITTGGKTTKASSEADGTSTELKEVDGIKQVITSVTVNTSSIVVRAKEDGSAEHSVTKGLKTSKAVSKIAGATTTISSMGEVETTAGEVDNSDGYYIKAVAVTDADGKTITRFIKVLKIDSSDITIIENTTQTTTPLAAGNSVEIDTISGTLYIKSTTTLDANIVIE